jgi:hypothetical protein
MISARRSVIICVLSLCCVAVGQSTGEQDYTIVSVCDMARSPASFDGRDVTVSGVAGNSFHQVDFWNPECDLPKNGGAILLRFAAGYGLGKPEDKKYFHLLRKEGAVGITLKGKFIFSGGPFGPEGAPSELLISSIIEVHKITKEYRKRYDIGSGKTNVGQTEWKRGTEGAFSNN